MKVDTNVCVLASGRASPAPCRAPTLVWLVVAEGRTTVEARTHEARTHEARTHEAHDREAAVGTGE